MQSDDDVYRSAQVLINQHGDMAEDIADKRMWERMEKGDPKGGGVWLAICCAIEDLRAKERQGNVH